MFNKFCIIFTLILLSYSNLVYSSPKNAIGEDQKTVNILNNYFSKQTMVGKANFQFLFWNMYDAKLISESGSYPSNKFALILKYNKDFSKKSVVDETINQLKKQKTFSEKELKEVKIFQVLLVVYQQFSPSPIGMHILDLAASSANF